MNDGTGPYGDHTEINRRFGLDAGHRLSEHDFKCQNLHGHRYEYEITIAGRPDPETGYVVDFSNVKSPIMAAFDHNLILNVDDPILDAVIDGVIPHQEKDPYTMPVEPTVENIAVESFRVIWESLSESEKKAITRVKIKLYETPNCDVVRRFTSELNSTEWWVIQ